MTNFKINGLRWVLFDWDNTLADSRPVLIEVVSQVLAEFHMPAWDIVKKRQNPDLSFHDNFPAIFGADFADKAYARYRDLYLRQVDGMIKTFPGVAEVLSFFRSHHIPLAIMTNKDRRLMDMELPLLFEPSWFKRIVCGHEAPHDKPHPEHIWYTLKGLMSPEQITPQTVWMIGDSRQDSGSALAAGARAIRIGCPIWGEEDPHTDEISYIGDFIQFNRLLHRDNP